MIDLDPKVPDNWRHLVGSWPLGLPATVPPKTRFDVNRWIFFSPNTIYFKDESSAATLLDESGVEQDHLSNVQSAAKRLLSTNQNQVEAPLFQYGYKRASPTRGMEYILDFDLGGKRIR